MSSQSATAKARAKLRSRDIRMTVRKLVDPDTGELIGALVPDHPIDRRSMVERKMYAGKNVRATLRQDRNPKLWRKAHVLAGWLADNVEQFAGLDMHQALKKLQELSGIGCDEEEFTIDLGSLGVHKGVRKVAQSLNFDDVDEGEFTQLWDGGTGDGGWIGWLRANVFGGLAAASREEVEEIIKKPEQGA